MNMKQKLNILDRDRTGKCFGECRDIAFEGMLNRQKEIDADPLQAPEYYPSVPWTKKRRVQPGWLGGHV